MIKRGRRAAGEHQFEEHTIIAKAIFEEGGGGEWNYDGGAVFGSVEGGGG